MSSQVEQPKDDVRVAVVVLNYCTPDLVRNAAESVLPQLSPRDRLILVDNASPDDSAPQLTEYASRAGAQVTFLQSPVNGGFAAGNNHAIRSITADAYLLLNSDTLMGPGALERLVERMQSDANIGLVSPQLTWSDGQPQTSCFRFHTPASELIAGAQSGPITRALQRYEVPMGVLTEVTDVEWTSFAAVLVRAEVTRKVGLLDEEFFMYYEDADYCRRVKDAGFRIVHDPSAKVVHLRGKSSPVKEATRLRKQRPGYYYESRKRYYAKTFGSLGLVLANSMWTVGRGVSWLREKVEGRPTHTVERELRDIWRLK